MRAEHKKITFDRHEWTLHSPVRHTEVEETIAVAQAERLRLTSRDTPPPSEIVISNRVDLIVVSFEAERPAVATRGTEARTDA